MANEKILVVDDEKGMREYLKDLLTKNGYSISLASNGIDALEQIEDQLPALVLSDIKMPKMDGIEFLEKLKKTQPQIPVIVMTAYGTVETAIKAMKLGAYDYINKPFDIDEILIVLKRSLEKQRLTNENQVLRQELESSFSFYDFVSRNKEMLDIFEIIKSLTKNKSTVLVTGETGTGKELVARAIHGVGSDDKPFVPVDCSTLREDFFEEIKDGTIYLDEIVNIPEDVQSKLLRVLEDSEFRLVACSQEDLEEAVNKNRLRKDLYFRLNVVTIELPPLRKRMEDMPLLIDQFINKYNVLENKQIEGVSEDALKIMMDYHWPGNVRELENLIHNCVVVKKTPIVHPKDLPSKMGRLETAEKRDEIYRTSNFNQAKKKVVELFEKRFIIEHLKKHNGNVTKLAEAIGLDRRNLQRKISQYNIDPKKHR